MNELIYISHFLCFRSVRYFASFCEINTGLVARVILPLVMLSCIMWHRACVTQNKQHGLISLGGLTYQRQWQDATSTITGQTDSTVASMLYCGVTGKYGCNYKQSNERTCVWLRLQLTIRFGAAQAESRQQWNENSSKSPPELCFSEFGLGLFRKKSWKNPC